MARTLYAGRPGDTVAALFNIGERLVYALPADANGDPTAVTLTVWDEPDGAQLTDLLAADGVTPITAVVVPPGTVQIPAFYGPDGVTDELWLRDPEGDYTRLDLGPPGTPGAAGVVQTVNGKTGAHVVITASDITTGTLPTSVLPPLAINETFVVANQAAMLALTAERGDMAVRTDNGRTYVLAAEPASTLANWREVLAAGQVQSVNSKTGAVVLSASDVGAQPSDVDLTAIAALTTTAYGRAFLELANAVAARTAIEAAGSAGGAREKILESTGSGAKPLDCAAYSGMVLTSLSGPVTISLTNLPSAAGWMFTYTVTIVQTGTVRAITWPTVSWVGGTAPADTASKTTIVTLWKYGTSSTIYGSHGTFG